MIFRALVLLSFATVSMAGEPIGNARQDERNPIRQLFHGQRLDLWSLQPVRAEAPPSIFLTTWPRHDMDRFILVALEKAGLSPAPEAERRALGRRLYFDLTGLPPSPEALDAFINDSAPDALERLVDKLLASHEYAEHWTRWWLDAVRYSDSNGYDWDEFRKQAWRFRDYVVRSFHADKPLDRLITEHLAGDEMIHGAPRDAAEQDGLIATGYLRMGPWDNAAKLFKEEHKNRAAWMADLTETTAGAFMGMTISCCRCHDHKTEPFSQEDHYRLRAFFENLQFADELPIETAAEQEEINAHNAAIEARAQPHDAAAKAVMEAARKLHGNKKDDALRKALTKEELAQLEAEETAAAAIRKERRGFTTALLATGSAAPATSHVLSQGDADLPKAEVAAGIPSLFDPQPATIPAGGGPRSTLAAWIVSPANPLTARVMANRIWQQCFGRGIVATPGDFGYSGTRPSHPALLDHLAAQLVQDGWSLKKSLRRLVTSATYRQSAYQKDDAARQRAEALDSDNTLLWHMAPRRLTAEQLRDAMLATAGTLQPCSGGPPRWPSLPDEVLAANPAFYDDNETKTKGWYPSKPEDLHIRSLYLIQKRSVRVPFMETFDLPDNFLACTRRGVSTVAPQAATLLHNPFSIECARDFAARLEKTAGTDPAAQITTAWRIALGRDPDAKEQATAHRLLQATTLTDFCRAVLNLNEFIYLD